MSLINIYLTLLIDFLIVFPSLFYLYFKYGRNQKGGKK